MIVTEKKKSIAQKLLALKVVWYIFGIFATLGFFFLVICPEVQMYLYLFRLYDLAANRGMLLVWVIHFVVMTLVIILGILFEVAIVAIFFSQLREAAFQSMEDLLKGKGLALSK